MRNFKRRPPLDPAVRRPDRRPSAPVLAPSAEDREPFACVRARRDRALWAYRQTLLADEQESVRIFAHHYQRERERRWQVWHPELTSASGRFA